MNKKMLLAILILIAFCMLPMFGQTTVYCPPSADAVVGSLSPSLNFGSSTLLLLGYDNVNIFLGTDPVGYGRSFIKYDLSSIPANATLSSAKIRLKQTGWYNPYDFTMTCFRVDQSWSESTITWSNKPTNITEIASATYPVTNSSGFFLDITSLAQEWVNGTRTNNGIFLVKGDVATNSAITFISKEHRWYPTNTQYHCLEVAYASSSSYALTVDVNNVPEGDPTIPGSNGGTVYLYDNSWNPITSKTTDANGVVIFTGLSNATYRYRVYITATNGLGTEFWGEGSATISGANLSQTFTRNWPFIEDITIQNVSTGATLYWGDTILPGTTLRFNIKVKNPNAQSVAAYPQAVLDRNKDLSFDLSSSGSPVTIASGSSNWFTVNVGPVNTAGDFFFGGRANSFYNSAYTLTDTNGYNNTQVFHVVQPTYSLNIDVDNVPEGLISMPGTYGTVILYDNSWNQLGSQATDAGGGVVFNSLVPATYRYRVYVYGPSGLGSEFWGEGQVTITSSNVTRVHVRDWPFIQDIIIENAATNETLYWGSTVPVGTSLRFKMKVKNPNTSNVSAKVQAILDRNRDTSIDFGSTSGSSTVISYSTYTWDVTLGPITTAGDYYFGGRCYSLYNSDANTLTDTNGYLFSNEQVIHVQTSNTLVFNIFNVSGGDPSVPGNFGEVTLFDTSWNEVTGIVNPQPTVNGVATFTNVPSGNYKYRVHVNSPSGFGTEFWGDGSVTAPQTVPTDHTRNWPYILEKKLEKYINNSWQEVSWGSSLPTNTQVRIIFTVVNPNSSSISGVYLNAWLDENKAEPYNYPNINSSSQSIAAGQQVNLISSSVTLESNGNYFLGGKIFADYNGSIITDTSAFTDTVFIKTGQLYSLTTLGALSELANIKGIIGPNPDTTDLHGQYSQNIKSVAYFTAQAILGASIYIDLCDYYSSIHPENPITQEGHDGWITVWIDGQLGLAFDITPAGLGILQIPFEDGAPDSKDNWDLSILGAKIPFLKTTVMSWNEQGFDYGAIDVSPNTEVGATIVNLGFSVARFEIRKEVLDLIIDAAIKNGNPIGLYSLSSDFTNAAQRFANNFIEYRDGWKAAPNAIVRNFTCSDISAATTDGNICHIRGGKDIDSDGIPDNYFAVLPTFYGIPFAGYKFFVTFQNTGTDTTDYFIQVKDDLPPGWTIGAIDSNGNLSPIVDRKIDIGNVPPVGMTGEFIPTEWAVCASDSAPDSAEVTFELYHDRLWPLSNTLLSSKTVTFHKLTPSGNIAPTLSITLPGADSSVFQGESIHIEWNDFDPDDNAYLALAYDPDINDAPWVGTNNHSWITVSLREDDDSNQFDWQTLDVPIGAYSIWGMIYDSKNTPAYSLAQGKTTILSSIGNLNVIINPQEAINAGAQWKLTVETVWHNSGDTISLAPGSYTVRFKTLEGWIMPANVDVTINPGQLTQISGTYTGIPIINKMPDFLSPVCAAGNNAPGAKIYIYNGGNGTLNYTLTDGGCAWLECSPASGSSTGETDMVDVTYSTSGLPAGSYNATITISDPNASNNPLTIPVNLTVNPVKTLSSIAIEGSSQVNENSSQDFDCRAYYSDSTNALVEPTWGENSAYASISGSGLLTTTEVPSDQGCQISASYTEGGVTKNATLAVTIKDVPPATPSISSLVPDQGEAGTPVTINGGNFGAAQGTVTFNGTPAAITSWSATVIQTMVPAGATTGLVVARTAGGVDSNGVTFTVLGGGAPEIDVKQGDTAIVSGGEFNFGAIIVGAGNDVMFTVENSGSSDLVLDGTPKINLSGAGADQYSVTQQPISPVVPSGSTIFIVRFAPTSVGTKSVVLSIANNDSDENPYVINISGVGSASDSLIKILYASETGVSVMTLNQDYSVQSKTLLANSPAGNPIWSRDGQKIAYGFGSHEIWTMNADGSNQAKTVTSSLYCGPVEWGIDPDIIFIGNSYAGDGEAAQLKISTGEIAQLTNVPGQNTQSYDLNNEQTKVAYVRGTEGNGWSNVLYYADFAFASSDFTNKILLSDAVPAPHEPRFSPSGTRILFLTCTSTATGLGLINTDGTGFTNPVPRVDGEHVYYGDWIDENRIVYLLSKATGRQMLVLNLQNMSTTPIADTADANGKLQVYTVAAPAATLSVLAPNGSDVWTSGEDRNITWESSGSVVSVNIDYSTDNGASWIQVVAGTANDGTHPWIVPDTPSVNCLVRVSDTDGNPTDTSDAVFTISSAVISPVISGTILYNSSPLSGVIMNGLPGNPVTDASGFYTSAVDYDWSGTVTPTLAGYAFTPASRTYANIITDQASQDYTAALVPSLQLTAPNGWEHWTLGATKTITWNVVNYTGTVRLVLFKSGSRFGNIAANIPATAGSYTWTVGQTLDSGMAPEGSDYRIYLRSTDGTIIDPSDSRLALIEPAQLELTSPNGGESWELGTTQNITWNANGFVGTVRLVLFQKGTKIGQIVANLPADQGSYAWTVGTHQAGAAPAGIYYSIRLLAGDGSQEDFNDGPLTLVENEALIVDHQHTAINAIPGEWLDRASRHKLLVLSAQGQDEIALELRLLGDRDARLAAASNASSLGLVVNEGSWLPQGAALDPQEWRWALEKAILDSQATVAIVKPDEEALLAGKLNAEGYLASLAELADRLPNVKLVWATVGMDEPNEVLTKFNRQVRESVLRNKGVLFDAADIESWRNGEQQLVKETPVKHPAHRARSGVTATGNLTNQGAATWWLLARLAGWEGVEPPNGE